MRTRKRRGQVLVEFAVGLPLIVTLLFFVIEAGFYLNAKQSFQASLREGAVLSVVRSSNGVLAERERPALVQAMLMCLSRPGLVNGTARASVRREGLDGCVVTVAAEARYAGLTPMRKMFDARPFRGRLEVPVGTTGRRP